MGCWVGWYGAGNGEEALGLGLHVWAGFGGCCGCVRGDDLYRQGAANLRLGFFLLFFFFF